MTSTISPIIESYLRYTCKCFFNHSAEHRQVPGSIIPSTPIINSYYSVVDLDSGLRLETSYNGSNCPTTLDPYDLTAYDTASATDFYCSCPNPNIANANSGNLLTIPAIGIIVSFLGAVLTSLGQVLMKWAHTHNELRALKDRKSYYANPMWYVGFITYAASQILTIVAFASVTQGENAVIGTVSLAANAIFAQKFLGEKMQKLHYVGMFFILAGSTMVLLSTLGVRCINTPEAVAEFDRALSPFHNLPFFLFMMLLSFVVLFALTIRRLGECSKKRTASLMKSSQNSRGNLRNPTSTLSESLLSSHGNGTSNCSSPEHGKHPNQHRLNELNSTQSSSSSMFGGISELGTQAEQYSDRAMLFVIISACMGCISSFCASVTVKLLTVEIQSFLTSISPWIVFSIFVISVCMSMHYLNRGLQSGQALLVVPGYFVGNTMLAMVCSLLYQKTYKYLTVFELIIFFFGFSSAIGGVVCMIWKEMHSDLDRTEAWKRRLAASPALSYHRQQRSSKHRQKRDRKNGTNGLPPRHGNNTGDNYNPYRTEVEDELSRSISLPFPGTLASQHDIIDPNYRGPSPVHSDGSINSNHSTHSQEEITHHTETTGGTEGSEGNFGNEMMTPKNRNSKNGSWKSVAVTENYVDSLSNQGNTPSVPYMHN